MWIRIRIKVKGKIRIKVKSRIRIIKFISRIRIWIRIKVIPIRITDWDRSAREQGGHDVCITLCTGVGLQGRREGLTYSYTVYTLPVPYVLE
jgi:hypothetical protein